MEIFSDARIVKTWWLMELPNLSSASVSLEPVTDSRKRQISLKAARDETYPSQEGWSGLKWLTHTGQACGKQIYSWDLSLAEDVLQDWVFDSHLSRGPSAGVTCHGAGLGEGARLVTPQPRRLPRDRTRGGLLPLLCWQIAQLWCYMSALALRISRDKPGMFCMPDSGAEPLH